jgi:demethylmenaquinone methyltransferase/2-methoxy-6-polyprenyl-1,4-benzoquinol methylase
MPLPAPTTADLPRRVFSPIASNYDRPAQILSLLQYTRWHDFLLSRLDPPPGGRVLDMATGTGAVADRLCQRDGLRVAAADVTRPMLLEAAARTAAGSAPPLDLAECTAEAVPFADAAFDAVVFAYLLRYVADVPSTLAELARVLKPGGTMASLDFAVPRGPAHPLWRLYTAVALPLGGALLSPAWRRVGAFLGPSIRDFYRRWPEERLLQLWRDSGFPDVRAKRLSLGGAIVIWGTKSG